MTVQHIELTAIGQGYYRVFVDGVERSKHITEREASESAGKLKRANPASSVHYDHDYRVRVDLVSAPVVVVPPDPIPTPPVVVIPDPVVVPPALPGRIAADDFELVGGWRIDQPFPRMGFAVDFAGGRVFASGHTQRDEIHEYAFVPFGDGENMANWPILQRVRTHTKFWGRGYTGGIEVRDGVLWVSPRVFYDTAPQALLVSGKNLTTGEITNIQTTLPQSAYGGGFVKGRGDVLLGCGGYESGHGSVSGPTCATLMGVELLKQAPHGTMDWNARSPREPNYTAMVGDHKTDAFRVGDSWVGLNPRDGEGRWASDKVHGGGIWTPRGLCYWPIMGTGKLAYSYQNKCLSSGTQNYLYTYSPETFDDVRYERWSHGEVLGSDIGPDGLIYLEMNEQWQKSQYSNNPVVKIFRLKK
jgi:hypothetical protein